MNNRLNDLHNKGEQDVARRREYGGIADDMVRLISGRDGYDHTPEKKEERDAYAKGFRNATK